MGQYVMHIGTVDTFQIHVEVENLGEIAYQTAFYIIKPRYLTWKKSEPVRNYTINTVLI